MRHALARGRVVTADALHTQTATVRAIVERGGHDLLVVLVVKDNQERLHAARRLLRRPPRDRLRSGAAPQLMAARARSASSCSDCTTPFSGC